MLYTMGRIPSGEQSFGYSKSFKSTNNTYSAKPISTYTMIRLKPVSQAKNCTVCYGPKVQK